MTGTRAVRNAAIAPREGDGMKAVWPPIELLAVIPRTRIAATVAVFLQYLGKTRQGCHPQMNWCVNRFRKP